MKTLTAITALAATLTLNAATVVPVDDYAFDVLGNYHDAPMSSSYVVTFRPSLYQNNTYNWGWWGTWNTGPYNITAAKQCDFVVVEFFDPPVSSTQTGIYIEYNINANWIVESVPAIPGQHWCAYRVYKNNTQHYIQLISYGTGAAPWSASYFEQYLPAY